MIYDQSQIYIGSNIVNRYLHFITDIMFWYEYKCVVMMLDNELILAAVSGSDVACRAVKLKL